MLDYGQHSMMMVSTHETDKGGSLPPTRHGGRACPEPRKCHSEPWPEPCAEYHFSIVSWVGSESLRGRFVSEG